MKRIRTFTIRVLVVSAILQLAALRNLYAAATVMSDFGLAGPSYYGLLVLGAGTLSWSGGGSEVVGNVGVSGSTSCSFSGSGTITGTLFESAAGLCSTGGVHVSTPVVQNFSTISANANAAVTDFSTMTSNATPTGTGYNSSNQTINGNATITALTNPGGGFTVVGLTSVTLGSGNTLTINGTWSSQVVIDITGGLSNQSGDILLTGGIVPGDVVFNIEGTGDALDIRGAGHTSSGIFLALNNTWHNHLEDQNIEGEVITGGNLQVISNPFITEVATPEPGTWMLLAGGFALLGACPWRRRTNPHLPAAADRRP